jgi:hypothetical protein
MPLAESPTSATRCSEVGSWPPTMTARERVHICAGPGSAIPPKIGSHSIVSAQRDQI